MLDALQHKNVDLSAHIPYLVQKERLHAGNALRHAGNILLYRVHYVHSSEFFGGLARFWKTSNSVYFVRRCWCQKALSWWKLDSLDHFAGDSAVKSPSNFIEGEKVAHTESPGIPNGLYVYVQSLQWHQRPRQSLRVVLEKKSLVNSDTDSCVYKTDRHP
jgi:hypothetical protein